MRPTKMVVHLNTLMENARKLRAQLPADVKMLCVVKADAYGHGAVEFARALEKEALADAFAVAIVEEARQLRDAGIRSMIVILSGGCEESLREAVRCDASQACYDVETLRILADEAKKRSTTAKAHLKLDTGMSRVGVRSDEALEALLDAWKTMPEVEMEGCFTHFCAAEDDEVFTRAQNARFEEMLARVRRVGFAPIAHAAASSAMLRSEFQHDMVRAGICLYGSCMDPGLGLGNAQTLSTRPVRIETIAAGDTVGYGRTFTAARETRVMTVPIGYGDGYPRALSNHTVALVRGKRVPNIGRVCMDMTMFDVTDVEGVTMSDEVVLLGAQGNELITPDELARLSDTIPYEIMLGFLPRIPREIKES